MTSIDERKRIVAEFMGYQVMEESKFLAYDYPSDTDLSLVMVDRAMTYDTSWDSLMPVVRKIEDLRLDAPPSAIEFDELKAEIDSAMSQVDIKLCLVRVVDFIKWHNNYLHNQNLFLTFDTIKHNEQ